MPLKEKPSLEGISHEIGSLSASVSFMKDTLKNHSEEHATMLNELKGYHTRLTVLETQRGTLRNILTPIVSLIMGAAGGYWGKHY